MKMLFRHRRLTVFDLILGIGLGILGQLYLPMGSLGTIAILDILSYIIGPLLLMFYWGKMGPRVRMTIIMAGLWTMAAVFANIVNFVDMRYSLKSVVVVATSITLSVVSYSILRRDARLYLLYALGWALGCWIALYYFKPGTWLFQEVKQGAAAIEVLMVKEIYPIKAYALFFSVFLIPVFFTRKIPGIFPIIGCFVAGFYLLYNGGSRSNFGICCATGLLGFGACYCKDALIRALRSKFSMYLIVIAAVAVIFLVYKYMAASGTLGEGEYQKYMHEFRYSQTGEGGFIGRGGYYLTLISFLHSPWGAGGTNIRHSVLSNSWNCEGLMGLIFWLFFFKQCFWFLRSRLIYTGTFSCFIGIVLVNACWAALGSPFGARNIYFSLLTFIALCQDNVMYGYGTVFERKN